MERHSVESVRVGPSSRKSDAQAARWVIRLAAGPLSPAEQQELAGWLEGAPRNRGAFVRAQAAWMDLDRVASLAHPGAGERYRRDTPAGLRVVRRRWVLAAGLGTVAITAVGGWWSRHARRESYSSGEGEVRRVTLSDGSIMTLNSDTEALVSYSPGRRAIALERGEALFEVTKDPVRPFVVSAANLQVRAVGTAFSVRKGDARTDVTVAEGVVEVSDRNDFQQEPPTRLAADELAVATSSGISVAHLTPQELERRLAWRQGMLAFDGQSLAEAVHEINRYGGKPIRIDDPRLAARPVVGLFRAGDSEGFAQTVAAALGADSVVGRSAIHLRAHRTR